MQPTPYRRTVATFAAVLHLAVAGAVPVADALLEAAAFDTELHIEAENRGPCAPAHDHLACQLCRTMGRPGAAGGSAVLAAVPFTVRVLPPVDPPALGGPSAAAPHGARAPPLA